MFSASRTKMTLLAGAAGLLLAACGSAEVASPGEGGFTPPGPTDPTGPTGPDGGPVPADCPTGFSNVGLTGGRRTCQLPSVIIGNLVVPARANTVYSLGGRVDVGRDLGGDPTAPLASGAQGILTVEPGVRIFGSSGADYIVVNRGSQIFAEGTSSSPIIFTSRQSVEGTTNENSIGQWGGLVILGRAPTAACPAGVTPPNLACTAQVEGTNAFYGGVTTADNSGRLRYVRVQHSGFEVAPGNELNGITLAGVGSGTTIEYVQVHNSSDDGIEPFGGTVNLRYIILTGNDDDSFDTDTGFRGRVQFMIVRQRAGGGDRAFESSSAGNQALFTRPTISNATIIGRGAAGGTGGGDGVLLNTGNAMQLYNSVVTGFTGACLDIDDQATVDNGPAFNSVFLTCATPFRADGNQDAATTGIFGAGANNATGTSTLNGVTNGANESARPVTAVGDSFFTATTYIGAVRDASDTWYAGWSCGITAGSTC